MTDVPVPETPASAPVDVRSLGEAVAGSAPAGRTFRIEKVYDVESHVSPPQLLVGNGDQTRPMPMLGSSWGYEAGQAVVWLEQVGNPVVIGFLSQRGSGDPTDPEDSELEDWTAPTLLNSWSNYGSGYAAAGYYLSQDYWVRLKGLVRLGTDNTTIFTLPAGYTPPKTMWFTVATNAVVGYLRVDPDGTVRKVSGGSNAYVSLDGVTWPVLPSWQGWGVPSMEDSWSYDGTLDDGVPRIYTRDDGWCYCTGVAANGTGGGELLTLPEDARPAEWSQMICVRGGSNVVSRLDISHRGKIMHTSGSAGTQVLGGQHWWSARADADAWVDLPLANGWAWDGGSYQYPQYRRDHQGVVHLTGLLRVTGKTSNTICNLPVGYRPLESHVYATVAGSAAGSNARLDVQADGDIVYYPGPTTGWCTLSGFSFRAEQ